MYIVWDSNEYGLVALSYWTPSPSNFLSLIVLSLQLDMRIHADAIKVLRVLSSSSAEELLRIVEALGPSHYRNLSVEAFAEMRLRAVESVTMVIGQEPKTSQTVTGTRSTPNSRSTTSTATSRASPKLLSSPP